MISTEYRCIGKRWEGTVSNYEERFHGNLCHAFGLFDSFLPSPLPQIIFYNEHIIFKLFYCGNICVCIYIYIKQNFWFIYIYIFFF